MRNIALTLLFIIAFSASSLSLQSQAQAQPDSIAKKAPPFPDLSLPAIANPSQFSLPEGVLKISSFPESVIIINVFSWFCAPCQAEGPDLLKLAEQIGAHGTNGSMRIIGVAVGDDTALTDKFRARHKLTYPLYADPNLKLHALMDSPPVPTFYVVRNTPDGPRLLLTHTGAILGKADQFLKEVEDRAAL